MEDTNQYQNNHLTTEIFNSREAAERAYQKAIERGYKPEDINVLMSEDTRKKYYNSPLVQEGNKSLEGLGVGSAIGATIGATIAAIAAVGTSVAIPGLGLIVAGPLAAGLAGAGAGGISGGLLGALMGWGIPEEKVKDYEAGIKSGGIVLGVNEDEKIAEDWRNYRNNQL